MSIQIERGLFQFDFTDHHAVLGVHLNADPNEIRKRYKQVARRLHPDSNQASTPVEKEQAIKLFSKLVSPAYSQLSKDRPRAEHMVILSHMGKRLVAEASKLQIGSDIAKQLAQATNIEQEYKSLVEKMAASQYETLNQAVDAIAVLSELNMVYLMRKEGEGLARTTGGKPQAVITTSQPQNAEKPPIEAPRVSPVDAFLRRAEDHINNQNFANAVLELREALTLEPNNSNCHGLLGLVYLKQNQITMGKIHINKALQLNPKDPRALQGKQALERLAGGGKTTSSKASTQNKPSDKSGGLFGGLFGGKKK